jgi:hypothetical protein
VPNAPAASCALCSWSMHTSIHSGGTGNIRHSPRNGFTAYTCSPRGPGSFAPVTLTESLPRKLSASVGAPGPHDFAVRQLHHRRGAYAPDAASVHRIPSSTSVTTAKRPSCEDGTKSKYSCFYPAVKLNSENQKYEGVRCLLSWAVIAARDRSLVPADTAEANGFHPCLLGACRRGPYRSAVQDGRSKIV